MRLALLAAILLAAAPAASVSAFPRLPAECSRAHVTSAGKTVPAAFCAPAGRGRAPAVIVLHGCGGFDTFDHRLAVELPRVGIATLYLDYFALTPPPGRRGFCDARGAFATAFPIWLREVRDAAAALRGNPRVDPARVGLVGWSLGGGLAVAAAASPGERFRALVGFSTGAFGAETVPRGLPPTLLLSGGTHDAIPLVATEALARDLRAAGVRVSIFVYPNGSHDWPGRQGTAGIRRAEQFLRQYLKTS